MHQPARSVSFSALLFLVAMIPICDDTVQLTEAAHCENSDRYIESSALPDWLDSGQSIPPQSTPSAEECKRAILTDFI